MTVPQSSPYFFDIQIEVDVGVDEPHELVDVLSRKRRIFKIRQLCPVCPILKGQTEEKKCDTRSTETLPLPLYINEGNRLEIRYCNLA